jgi:hypothetical protein
MKYLKLIIIALLFSNAAIAQNRILEIGAGIGKGSVSPGLAVYKNYYFGKKDRIILGTGIRYTGYFGKDIYLSSAPNDLAVDLSKTDSLLAPSPAIHAINVPIVLGYKINSKLSVGFDIDAAGLSFGPTGTPTFIANGKRTTTSAKPTSPNVLLVGNNDKGSLNSMFYANIGLTEKIGIRAAYQFLFNELTTDTKVQTNPVSNDRFRVKSSQIFIGLHVKF